MAKKVSSGLSVDDRTLIGRVESVLGPLDSSHGGEYHRVIWSIYDINTSETVQGYTDVVHHYRNWRQWRSWVESVESGSFWVVVVHDDLTRHKPDWICIDADYKPVCAEGLM